MSSILTELESKIGELSHEEQLRLLETLTESLQQSEPPWDKELAAMATDPAVQAELGRINREFAIAEQDGLAQT